MAEILLARQNNGEFAKQRTKEWNDIRMKILTASDIASVLDCNIYQSGYELMTKKLSNAVVGNLCMEWGNKFEPIALEIYKKITNESVNEIGLVLHPIYKWLGASPDGLSKSKLLEIKCPYKRNIGPCPIHYWVQMQIQMEVCNIDECDYFDCKFYECTEGNVCADCATCTEFKGISETMQWCLKEYSLKTIARDKEWFANNIEKINGFYNKMKLYQENGGYESAIKINKKRKIAEISYDMSMFIDWKQWVDAYDIKNFMIDDPINDWLNRIDIIKIKDPETRDFLLKSFCKNKSIFNDYVNKNAAEFKKTIMAHIINKIPCVYIENMPKSHKGFLNTMENIKKSVPVIFNAVLHDYKKQIYGVADILIRADYISKLFNMKSNDKHYRIIEIKHTTLHLCADNINLRNTKNIYCKGKTYMLNKILGEMQGYAPSKSYIMGKNIICKKDNKFTKCDSFERLASVDFNSDKSIRKKTALAVDWVRSLERCNDCALFPPTSDELRPNMCVVSDFQTIKTAIAYKQNEITELWMCGIKNRKVAISNNIINWRAHPKITSAMLGIHGKPAETLQLILEYNTNNSKIIYPKKIKSKLFDWREHQDEFFIDFETMPDVVNSMIFMAGVGYFKNDQFIYKCFIADDITVHAETKLINELTLFITSLSDSARLWHWSHAEKTIYKAALVRTGVKSELNNWCDLLQIFKEEPIVVRGALNFSLKSIVHAFNMHGFIDISYKDSKVSNGLDAMCLAYNEYKANKHQESDVINGIKDYNEVDVKSLFYILFYLRNKH